MKSDLKPCPFCGSAATLEDERLLWVARCTGCGACVLSDRAPEPEQEIPAAYWERIRQSAVDRWNRRAALAQPELEEQISAARIAQILLAHSSVEPLMGTSRIIYQSEIMPLANEICERFAKPVPEGPSDDNLKNAVREALKDYKYSTEIPYFLDGTEEEPMMIALRAVCSLGHHAAPLPTEDEMNDLADEILGIVLPEGSGARLIRRALELWGRPAIEPVPVSEHLPGPEDCDSEGRCWYFHIKEDGVVAWIKQRPTRISRCPIYRLSHWLPHWALPVPDPTNFKSIMTPHQLYVDKIEALHPMLQISLCDWIEKELPKLALQLDAFVIPSNGNYLTLDAVTKRMAEAALAVLLASVEATGCHKP